MLSQEMSSSVNRVANSLRSDPLSIRRQLITHSQIRHVKRTLDPTCSGFSLSDLTACEKAFQQWEYPAALRYQNTNGPTEKVIIACILPGNDDRISES